MNGEIGGNGWRNFPSCFTEITIWGTDARERRTNYRVSRVLNDERKALLNHQTGRAKSVCEKRMLCVSDRSNAGTVPLRYCSIIPFVEKSLYGTKTMKNDPKPVFPLHLFTHTHKHAHACDKTYCCTFVLKKPLKESCRIFTMCTVKEHVEMVYKNIISITLTLHYCL